MHQFWRPLRIPARVIIQHVRITFSSRRGLSNMGSKMSRHHLPDSFHQGIELDPYNYTSGRWLNQDELQRASRSISFNFSELGKKVISLCPGATKIIKCEKREGGFNRVFLFTMDTGSCVAARLPTNIAGPPRLTTNSEYNPKISLPIPKILDWNDNPSNPTGTEYIIQEHVPGVQLHQIWPKMNSEQHMLCTKALSLAMRDMASLKFPAYGSLYFSDGPLESHLKIPFEAGFCVGPHCGPVYWNRGPGELDMYGGPSSNCGPWKDLASYCLGLIETGFSRLPRTDSGFLPHQGSLHDHASLLETSQQVMQKLIVNKSIQNAATPALLHPDFHKRNIYVSAEDPTVITGVIDWQSASIEPAFIYANETPDFAAVRKYPEGNTFENEQDEHHQKRQFKDASICYQTYDLSARWTELGLSGTCPFSLTAEELAKHATEYEDFETVQTLKVWLQNSLDTNSDGWVPNDEWDTTKEANRAAYDEWIQTTKEVGEITVEKADEMWPFDAR
ncbi:uncharacterized protein TRUGW13939_05999 [Talaromyces rugulosus]|uniref:Altered inheritance of mitochondria protein 9, mitochondrial n=1 Tax=Talaromyces rugulosus TaxID=121627 RepID=A0A7H8QZN4_TALRU|nr:uncharacterized protein TRUGW13939_05999 [Talaromyces rugulosus]QKX58871.1 hypothetical protein TRUGW13939_05999 [Talaromyces rugulosus]